MAALVVGEDGLNDAHLFGELDLGEALVLADASEALAEGLITEIEGRELTVFLGMTPMTVRGCFRSRGSSG